VSVIGELPREVPMDLIVGSRELLRGKVRLARLRGGYAIGPALLFTLNAYSYYDDHVRFPYWVLTLTGCLVGLVLGSIPALMRAQSAERQQNAIQAAWSSALLTSSTPRTARTRLVVLAAVLLVTVLAVGFLWVPEWPYRYFVWIPLAGSLAGIWLAQMLQTFRWASWYAPGVIDPDVARQLVLAQARARKVQDYALAGQQAIPGDQ
jgi:hypothetical protein